MKKILFLATLCLSFFSAAETLSWRTATANTPSTAYALSDAAHWEGGAAPRTGDKLVVSPANRQYLSVSGAFSPRVVSGNANAVFLGDVHLVEQPAETAGATRASWESSGWLYGDLFFAAENFSTTPYLQQLRLCGRLHHSGTASRRLIVPSGTLTFRFDRFARSAQEERTDDFDGIDYFCGGNGILTFHAPAGAVATSGVWRLEKGSPYASRQSALAHPLAVGTRVSGGAALPEGVFLKHVFDEATVELSAPATESGDVLLSFASFSPRFAPVLKNEFRIQGADVEMVFERTRAEDDAKIVFAGGISGTYDATRLTLGSQSAASRPGTFVLGAFTRSGWPSGALVLRNVHLAFRGNVAVPATHPVTMEKSAAAPYAARLTVTNGQTVSVAKMRQLHGRLEKDGAGDLALALDTCANEGQLAVRGGRLILRKTAGAPEGQLSFASLSVAENATVVLPPEGMQVETLAVEPGATLAGGELVVRDGHPREAADLTGVRLLEGAQVTFCVASGDGPLVTDVPAGEVVGHPAFWLDASQTASLAYTTENGVHHVTRWNDCRAGETMFCTNLVLSPTLVIGETARGNYVRIANHPGVSDYRETEILVWNRPLRDIRAVFLVQNPVEGGGAILGRCSWRVPNSYCANSYGGPYYRYNYTSLSQPLISVTYATPSVLNGRFFLDGLEVDGSSTLYLGDRLQVVEHHVNTNYPSGSASHALVCDAFGGGYMDGNSAVGISNGGMRIAEYIIYTNSLTHAERIRVAQYLSRKWCGRNVRAVAPADPKTALDLSDVVASGAAVSVSGENAVAATGVAGGTLIKKGPGALYVESLAKTAVKVEAGVLALSAIDRRRHVPADTWLHVDAAERGTIQTAGENLVQWADVHRFGQSLRNYFSVPAKVVASGMNGLPLIDLGAISSAGKSAGLMYYGANGEPSPNYDKVREQMAAPLIRSCFAVVDSSAGGGTVFGGVGGGYPSKGLPHCHTQGDASPIVDEPAYVGNEYHGLAFLQRAIKNGTALFRRNGETVNPFETPFLKGAEWMSLSFSTGRKMTHFGAYGQNAGYCGGLKYGEIVLFERALSDAEAASVERYLSAKWLGRRQPGIGADATAVDIAPGAQLKISGTGFTAESLSGGGTLSGDVRLVPDGELKATVAPDGSVPCLTVDGSLRADSLRVRLSGALTALAPGTYPLLAADGVTLGADPVLTVEGNASASLSVLVSPSRVALRVRRRGLTVICR